MQQAEAATVDSPHTHSQCPAMGSQACPTLEGTCSEGRGLLALLVLHRVPLPIPPWRQIVFGAMELALPGRGDVILRGGGAPHTTTTNPSPLQSLSQFSLWCVPQDREISSTSHISCLLASFTKCIHVEMGQLFSKQTCEVGKCWQVRPCTISTFLSCSVSVVCSSPAGSVSHSDCHSNKNAKAYRSIMCGWGLSSSGRSLTRA